MIDAAAIDTEAAWHACIAELSDRVNLAQPDELAGTINAVMGRIGVKVTVYLVDHEQRRLWPVPEHGKPTSVPLSVDGTVAGRAFTLVRTHQADEQDGPYRLWVPLIDGAERLGVAEAVLPRAPADTSAVQHACETLVGLVGHLVTVKMPYGDALHLVRRTRPMTAAAELLTRMLPPLTFSCRRASVSAILEPCYDIGGDAFDYTFDGPVAGFMILDAMGRGLDAGLTCATALAALRAARRDEHDLHAMARSADAALTAHFSDLRFVTGVLAELNMDSGLLRYLNAGHPAPLLLRNGKAVRELLGGRRLPIGLSARGIQMGEELLEPGDRLLLFTDGVVEAFGRGGDRFGVHRLIDLAQRCAAAGLPGPETLRRLTHSVLEHQEGPPRDDATLMMFEWSPQAATRTQP
ncbi:PP2C family protein-serine/threonine phosphatase [Micromonospora sp. CPCC 206061]|uniref:PP2C family protein-serine/threonine phosphatase n=1 Tax=Micromonospora sp. CPCC 206061 TaxID=3122410 RepID=UPI002FF3A7D8